MDQVIPARSRGVGAASEELHDVSKLRVSNEQLLQLDFLLSSESITVIEGYGIVCACNRMALTTFLVPD